MDEISSTPFYIDIYSEYWQHKSTLNKWHQDNNYSDVYNSEPYPKHILFRMLDILEIIDNMHIYSPPYGYGYTEAKTHFQSSSSPQ